LHSFIAKAVYDLFIRLLPPGYVVRREDPLTLADSEPEPDVAVVKGSPSDFVDAHPVTAELVVEVAVSSPGLDRENISLYAEAGVKEYWIILGRERIVEVYSLPERGRYSGNISLTSKKRFTAPACLGCALRLRNCSPVNLCHRPILLALKRMRRWNVCSGG
jgi:Uma2 family endonuclease